MSGQRKIVEWPLAGGLRPASPLYTRPPAWGEQFGLTSVPRDARPPIGTALNDRALVPGNPSRDREGAEGTVAGGRGWRLFAHGQLVLRRPHVASSPCGRRRRPTKCSHQRPPRGVPPAASAAATTLHQSIGRPTRTSRSDLAQGPGLGVGRRPRAPPARRNSTQPVRTVGYDTPTHRRGRRCQRHRDQTLEMLRVFK